MAIGSGLSSSFGWSKETVAYGTRVAPAKFVRAKSCDFQYAPNRAQGEGITAGYLGPRVEQYVQTHEQATASVGFDVPTLGALQLWENLMGGSSSSVVTGTAYGHTFTLADNYATTDKSLTLQQNVPLRDGTTKAKEIVGAKASSATVSVGVGELLGAEFEFDGRKYDKGQTLASPSYAAGVPFPFKFANLKMGTYNSESAVTGVRAFSVTINRPMDTEAFHFNATGLKSQPVLNGLTEITGTIEADYLNTSDLEDRVHSMSTPSLVFECVSTTAITGSTYWTWRITLPSVTLEPSSINVDGTDATRNSWSFQWRYDGSNMPAIYVISTETSA